jgi:hypothetical protein
MKIIKVSNEKEYILSVFKSIKDELYVVPTKENKVTIILCEETIFEEIKEFLEIISSEDLNKYNRRSLIEFIKTNHLRPLGNGDLISNYTD